MKLADGVGHYSGVQRCGSVWACAPCAAKIRAHRAEEVSKAAAAHIASGGSLWMVTLTVRHYRGDSLKEMMQALPKAWKNLIGGQAWRGNPTRGVVGERDRLGCVGWIRSTEIMYGGNGWHPHLHVLVFLDAEPDTIDLAVAMGRWTRTWRRDLRKAGFEPDDIHGVKWDRCDRPMEAAEYVVKVQDGGNWSVGSELARGDLKAGKLGSITPFQLLDYFTVTGDASALDLWHEFERGTKGHRALTWSKGFRAEILPDEEDLTDEEVAEAEVGGEVVATFDDEAWAVVVEVQGMYGAILRAVEGAGSGSAFDAVTAVLAPYGVTPDRPSETG